ncbi:MAG: VCBS repeat-containing protein [Geobacter sp.]|nr:VCBS repeat-containing protein [Geobacter sp.]
MPSILLAFISVFLLVVAPSVSSAAPLKTYVSEFSVVGAPNKDELKVSLQGLLASRLNPDRTQLVENQDKAELLLSGSYAMFGKMFSVDVLLKNALTGSLTKVFEQGETQDDLIPAFGRLAQKIDLELAKTQQPTEAAAKTLPAPIPAVATAAAPANSYKIAAPIPIPVAEQSYVVKTGGPGRNTPGSWMSDPISGVFSSIALGRTLPSGEREIFVASEHSIIYLRKGTELKQIAEIAIPVPARILAIDTADLDHDGTPEIYVSIVDRKTVSSRVYQASEKGFELVADGQPWLFRGIGLDLRDRKIFAQGVTSDGEYFNEIFEIAKSGQNFKATNSRTLPRTGNIFNFTTFRDTKGADKLAIVDEDGYLAIYAADGSELWKSSDKYGGSETSFNYESVAQLRAKGDKYRWNFLEQRIMPLPGGVLIIPRNEGTFSVGNNRSYNKHSLFGLEWSGAILREIWHTRLTPSYLADYAYDSATNEVVLLEVVQKAGLFVSGKTAVSTNKLD